jgi:hypothetical protein
MGVRVLRAVNGSCDIALIAYTLVLPSCASFLLFGVEVKYILKASTNNIKNVALLHR